MGKKPNDPKSTRCASLIFLLMIVMTFSLVYMILSLVHRYSASSLDSKVDSLDLTDTVGLEGRIGLGGNGCCRGVENWELWGSAVNWGADFKLNSSEECCKACKAMCDENVGPCLCDSWVFCGDEQSCGSKLGECWLKKQKDVMSPEKANLGESVRWTSGLIFGKEQGIVGLETEYGTLRVKLYPNCAPHSAVYILELLELRLSVGCQFFRAEGRGQFWDSEGNHIKYAQFGPPFALIQGTLEVETASFMKIPTEVCPTITRGSVAWINNGPEFFISLANHKEWKQAYTVFGSVIPEDMGIAEKLAQLPTKSDSWNNIDVSILEKPVPFSVRRIKASAGNLSDNTA